MAARDAGLEIWNYTVNDARSMLNKMSKGLTGIITDNAHDLIRSKVICEMEDFIALVF